MFTPHPHILTPSHPRPDPNGDPPPQAEHMNLWVVEDNESLIWTKVTHAITRFTPHPYTHLLHTITLCNYSHTMHYLYYLTLHSHAPPLQGATGLRYRVQPRGIISSVIKNRKKIMIRKNIRRM